MEFQKSRVVFRPINSTEVPQNFPSSFALPSAFYYYTSSLGEKIPAPVTTGSPQEQQLSLTIWYSMRANEIFPLETVYARAREDQIATSPTDRPRSVISLSMKNRLRQFADSSDGFFEDRFQLLLGQMKRPSLEQFIGEMLLFPLAPSSDPFEAARLIEQYIRDGNDEPISRYFADRGVTHLIDHPYSYYPVYHLFFLMTRYASYPMNQEQLLLANRRRTAPFGSPEQIFIDAIFDYEIHDIDRLLQLIDRIALEGPGPVGREFKTNHHDWYRWGDEYLQNADVVPIPVDNFAEPVYLLSQKLYTWTDDQIDELVRRMNFDPPIRDEYPTRISYIESLSGTIALHRSDPKKWIDQTETK
uniref:Uncharacterized protein n=1 Tax=viral metagenome TaxID=1070528 RepID=A0A6C0IWS9_9ZZZZ